MNWHPIQGEIEILLVASCHGNRDKLRPDGPLGLYADFTKVRCQDHFSISSITCTSNTIIIIIIHVYVHLFLLIGAL